ncbi:hypothetical protein CBM2629_A60154 [Cupriavidus taiwanensis]|nr:hypothetical protein CBM2629_A60154 [Cupriavidus taiwanensis]
MPDQTTEKGHRGNVATCRQWGVSYPPCRHDASLPMLEPAKACQTEHAAPRSTQTPDPPHAASRAAARLWRLGRDWQPQGGALGKCSGEMVPCGMIQKTASKVTDEQEDIAARVRGGRPTRGRPGPVFPLCSSQ